MLSSFFIQIYKIYYLLKFLLNYLKLFSKFKYKKFWSLIDRIILDINKYYFKLKKWSNKQKLLSFNYYFLIK